MYERLVSCWVDIKVKRKMLNMERLTCAWTRLFHPWISPTLKQ